MEIEGTASDDSCIIPESNTDQCIFYPVKEEEREVQTNSPNSTTGASVDAQQTEHQETDSNSSESTPFPVKLQDYEKIFT